MTKWITESTIIAVISSHQIFQYFLRVHVVTSIQLSRKFQKIITLFVLIIHFAVSLPIISFGVFEGGRQQFTFFCWMSGFSITSLRHTETWQTRWWLFKSTIIVFAFWRIKCITFTKIFRLCISLLKQIQLSLQLKHKWQFFFCYECTTCMYHGMSFMHEY